MQAKQLSLSTARWVVLAAYLAGLVIYPLVGVLVKPVVSLPPELLRLLSMILLCAAVTLYIVSLIVEAMILARARRAENSGGAATAAVITGAFGESIALFGLVLALLGAGSWGALLYGLCFVHGVHLMIRWPNLEAVTDGR